MGEIWVARNEMTSAEVAVKVLRGDLDRKLEVEARFRHEAQLGAMLTHRNIVRVFDLLLEPDGALVLVMELLRGETLRRHLKSGPISAKEAVAIMLPILSALHHAHEEGIIHRDLKPANILLAVDPDGHVTPKLLDFGIAKVPTSSVKTMFGRVLGTPRYMSPEQIRADPKIDGRSDIFSAAVLLVEMITGASPFAADSPSASLASVLEDPVDPDPRIDPRLWLVIQRALAKRPYERYANAAEFAAALKLACDLTDGELHEVLQQQKPVVTDPLAGFQAGDDDSADSEEDDADCEPSVQELEPALASRPRDESISRSRRTGAHDAPRELSAPVSLTPEELGLATGAMSVPMQTPGHKAKMVMAGAGLLAIVVVIGALMVRLSGASASPSRAVPQPATAAASDSAASIGTIGTPASSAPSAASGSPSGRPPTAATATADAPSGPSAGMSRTSSASNGATSVHATGGSAASKPASAARAAAAASAPKAAPKPPAPAPTHHRVATTPDF